MHTAVTESTVYNVLALSIIICECKQVHVHACVGLRGRGGKISLISPAPKGFKVESQKYIEADLAEIITACNSSLTRTMFTVSLSVMLIT